MPDPTHPPILTEDTGNPPYTGCTFCTAVMMAKYGGIPLPLGLTTDEHHALVKSAGLVVGHEAAKLTDVQRGYQHRYGVQAHLFRGNITALARLGPAYALVQGRYGSLPVHFRRWDLGFTGIHAAGVILPDLWWQDPLATQRMIDAGFTGEPISLADLNTYALGFGGSIHALYLKQDEFAASGGPVSPGGPVYEFTYRPLGATGAPLTASITVVGPGHSYLLLKDGSMHPIAAGTKRAFAVGITLSPPIPGGLPGEDRKSAWLIGDEAAAVLAKDVTAVLLPPPGVPAPPVVVTTVDVHLSDGRTVVTK